MIGGAPAAAVVFAGEVEARARKDTRLQALNDAISKAEGAEKNRLRTEYNELFNLVHSEKLGEVAAEFDKIHSVHRALKVGALNHILPPHDLRPFLIQAVRRGMRKCDPGMVETSNESTPEGVHASNRHMVSGTD